MDLNQTKLTKIEWNSIEHPVPKEEETILRLIQDGYDNVNIKRNGHDSIFTYLKIAYNEKIEDFLFNQYLRDKVESVEKIIRQIDQKYKNINVSGISRVNSADRIRLEKNVNIAEKDAFEFILLKHAKKIMINYAKLNDKKLSFHFYTLMKLMGSNVPLINRYVKQLCNYILLKIEDHISKKSVITYGVDILEKNKSLLQYSDLQLYEHQKEIFSICKKCNPKLILYIAPTGTGKTLTPIGLSEQNRIIFVCAARHVGLALAKSAISVNKKVAFAFGCETADDIRLHYFAAKNYSKNKKSGGIGKVDNSVGDNVEIMICDIKSYLPAMYYMLSFNEKQNIILYWDEPTITMDYENHDFHETIHENWEKNLIPNVVLSSATLPKEIELTETIHSFKTQQLLNDNRQEPIIANITSHDCKKSIPIINTSGQVVLPHLLSDNYDEIINIVSHCEENKTLLRYFDLDEVIQFITFVNNEETSYIQNKYKIERYFCSVREINMLSLKIYYLVLLKNILSGTWGALYITFRSKQSQRITANIIINSEQKKAPHNKHIGIYVTTKDSYTLTDGPTIYLCSDIRKISMFCIQQANIPVTIMENLMKKINYNNGVNEKIFEIESEIEFKQEQMENKIVSTSGGKEKTKQKSSKKICRQMNDTEGFSDISRLTNELNALRSAIQSAVLNDIFIPNKRRHIEKWALGLNTEQSFTSNITDDIVGEIMSLHDVEDNWKILLLMGIGVFINHNSVKYREIMKKLADEQKLFMIIASSDYIYGTNIQVCHLYIGKDLDLTQEKIIQSMGRAGRGNIQQNYTVRFRNDDHITKLFKSDVVKPEVINMNKLFSLH